MANRIKVGILTISDRSSRGERPDLSGPALSARVQELGWIVSLASIVPDEITEIKNVLLDWCAQGLSLILTTGGTGFTPRDVTPEATLAVLEKVAPGLSEAMRNDSLKMTPHAMLSRAIAGIRGSTLIINLPGSPKAALENFSTVIPIIPHAVELLSNDPNSEAGHIHTKAI
jgi:molybdopterin adenylyltransferase